MLKEKSKIPENSSSQELVANQESSTNSTTLVNVEKYVKKRNEKAKQQINVEEKNALPAQTKVVWDEMTSYKYAIF